MTWSSIDYNSLESLKVARCIVMMASSVHCEIDKENLHGVRICKDHLWFTFREKINFMQSQGYIYNRKI